MSYPNNGNSVPMSAEVATGQNKREEDEMSKSETSIYLLIDRSGSMIDRWGETLGAVNTYVEELAKAKETKKAKATVCLFDGQVNLDFLTLRNAVPVSEWKPLTSADAAPRGMTPLFDAIGKLAGIVDGEKPKQAVVVVVTDGAENVSREVTREGAKAHLDRLRGCGYQVVFLGADFNAFGQSASVGTAAGQTLNMSAGNYANAFKGLANSTMAYAATGRSMSFSDEDRKRAAK